MACETFRVKKFNQADLTLLAWCKKIIGVYMQAGYTMTLRQLYYQLVTKNIVTNEEKSYKRVGRVLSDGRLAGLIDWEAIEDRGRQPRSDLEFTDPAAFLEWALGYYRLPRWAGQKHYVELWVEKEALAGVLRPIASEFHVTLMVNKGYSSQSAMYESSRRFLTPERIKKRPVLLYLGDLDPSGEDMVRDVEERLVLFGVENIHVKKLALTMDQVDKYNPPPNPAKLVDPRAKDYVAKYGYESWEVDALPPDVLGQIISKEFKQYIDVKLVKAIKEEEAEHRARLEDFGAQLEDEYAEQIAKRKRAEAGLDDEFTDDEPEEDDDDA